MDSKLRAFVDSFIKKPLLVKTVKDAMKEHNQPTDFNKLKNEKL